MGKDLFNPFARKSMVGRAAVVLILGKPKGSKQIILEVPSGKLRVCY